MISYSFLCVVLLNYAFASVLRNGIDINVIPIPGTHFEDGLIGVNSVSGKNVTGRRNVVETHNVTVRTPFLTIQSTNSSELPKSLLQDSILSEPVSLLPKGSDLDDATVDLDIPVRLAELASLATVESPAQFREKFYGSSILENIISDIEDKAKYYYEVKNLLSQPTSLVSPKKHIVKREVTWTAEQNPTDEQIVDLVHHPKYYMNHKMMHDIPKFSNFVYSPEQVLAERTVDEEDEYPAGARIFLPHRHLFAHPRRRLIAPRIHGHYRPPLPVRSPVVRPIIRPLLPPSTFVPFVRAFSNPEVIKSLLQAIPHFSPIVPREDQVVHPPITSYPTYLSLQDLRMDRPKPSMELYEKPPEDSDFIVHEKKTLPPLVNSFITLLQDLSITR